MLPTLAPIVIPPTSGGTPGLTAGIWTTRPSSQIDPAVAPLADEGLITALQDQSPQNYDAIQFTTISRPTADDDVAPGVFVARFSDVDYLAVSNPLSEVYWLLVAGLVTGPERVIVSRDTSQAGTTKPAFEIAIVEDLQ